MEEIRSLILKNDKSFSNALKAYKSQNVFSLCGEMYKREHFPGESPEKQEWLNRRNIFLACESKDFELLFSDGLAEKIAADFKAIAPVYKLFMTAEENLLKK